ncbi:MAG: phosphate acyltransferase PlsX [Candidatus Omnitrophica bacterium]|nr:phosphate acyltransferase PlsX [Candidatus Omnitrophota bacterium]
MGGDNAPSAIVAGAVRAARELPHRLVLVGQREAIERELANYPHLPSSLTIHHASEIVGMHESPAVSIRKKRDSSISVAVQLAKERQVDAVLSAGNTGAMVAAGVFTLGLLPGIERPGIGIVLPGLTSPSLLIDVGANIEVKPLHLLQYGIMGASYVRQILHVERPRVGLLNIGEEASKGTDLMKEAFALLEQSSLNFIGNVEGRDIYASTADVIVCDGFVGNVALKASESLAKAVAALLKRELTRNLLTKLGARLARPAFAALRKEIDYAEYGGAPLLGIEGVCIICHGASSSKAIKNAVAVAAEFVQHGLNDEIVRFIQQLPKVQPA